ncbi:MAG: polysaccharide biosynthesis/export family protein [Puniceicoccales bacterium]
MQELNAKDAIKVGDQLEYMVIEDREPPEVLLVDEEGQMDVPLLGRISAVGYTPQSLALHVSELLKKDYYHQATVVVEPYKETGRRGVVYVMGEIPREGAVEIPSGEILRVSGAIMRAGGFNVYADPSRVMLIRPDVENPENSERMEVNVAEILETGRMDRDLIVKPNDRIFVARRGDASGQYTVTGAIRGPGVYPIAIGQKLTVSEAVLAAGGFAPFANGARVKLIRHNDQGVRTETEIDVEEILEEGRQDQDVLLKDGDRLIVPEKFISF